MKVLVGQDREGYLLRGQRILPLLRWVGGKRQIISQLLQYVPQDIAERTYREPFLGAGSLFFALQLKVAYLSDANEHLIQFYRYIRENPDLIHVYLQEHRRHSSEEYYYSVREEYNRSRYSVKQAARFLYLNKTCFNGIFRVNKRGEFNVPYGRKEPPPLPTKEHLKKLAKALESAHLDTLVFTEALNEVAERDFVYLDPPYPPLNGTANFTHYTADRFLEWDQRKLAKLVFQLDRVGCRFMMTNADLPLIRELYCSYQIHTLSVMRHVSCKSKKHRVSELVITNYEVPMEEAT